MSFSLFLHGTLIHQPTRVDLNGILLDLDRSGLYYERPYNRKLQHNYPAKYRVEAIYTVMVIKHGSSIVAW